MIKFAYLINRVEGMSVEAFVDHHRHKHAPLFSSIPEAKQYVRRYAISHPVAAPNYPAPAYDGLTEIWFDSWADHDAFFTSKNYLETVQPDERTFVDHDSVGVMVTEERVVIG
ncbi:EthD domain-containing protein [Pleomorphomonas sp. PLEO]|uniref:EthD domain-containing protein n=1 Tax=Pleomorphomonas sp. PLEO TaxID=3239306 RepID=UPI00351F7F4E